MRSHWKFRLNGALKHAEAEAKKFPGLLIYAFVVNGAKIGEDRGYYELYQNFLASKKVAPDGDIRIVPMNVDDFNVAAGNLFFDLGENLHFSPDILLRTLDTVHQAVLAPALPEEITEGWMMNLFLNTVKDGVTKTQEELVLGQGPGMPF